MNYKSKAVPVVAEQVLYNSINAIDSELFATYGEDRRIKGGLPQLKDVYGGTVIDSGDWLVEFPNGEIHVVRDEQFKQRFEHVNTYTPEEVKNAISMARALAVLGGESS